jgi:hypothetical protein
MYVSADVRGVEVYDLLEKDQSAVEGGIEQNVGGGTAGFGQLLLEGLRVQLRSFLVVDFVPLSPFLHVAPVVTALQHSSVHYYSTQRVLAVFCAAVI